MSELKYCPFCGSKITLWIEINSVDDLPPVNSKFIVQVTGGYVDFVKFTMQDDIMPLFVGESEQYLLSDLVRFFSIPQPPKAEE